MDRVLPALRSISHLLEENQIQWCVRGSIEKYLAGQTVDGHNDIDINTDKAGFQKVMDLLQPANMCRRYEADVLEASVEGFPIEVMSFDDESKNAANVRRQELFYGITVYTPDGPSRI